MRAGGGGEPCFVSGLGQVMKSGRTKRWSRPENIQYFALLVDPTLFC